jgi:putative transposase
MSTKQKKDMQLKEEIKRIYYQNRKRYGSPRIYQQLLREGYPVGKKRVARLMQELNIQAVAKGEYKATIDSAHSKPVAENHLNRNTTPDKPNTSWVADISAP